MPGTNKPSIRIHLLGRFALSDGQTALRGRDWSRRKAAALLQRLALEERLLRAEALEFLWPGAAREAAANNLYRTLYSLRQTVDATFGEGTADTIFSYRDAVLRLADGVWVDVHAFEALSRDPDATLEMLEEAISLYQGPLLPASVYNDWTRLPRQTLHRLYRDTCLRLAQQAGGKRAIEAAVAQLRPFLEEDPADEVIHRQLMRLFAQLGRRHDALRQYQWCMEALEAHMGVMPAPETRRLHEQIVSDGGQALAARRGAGPGLPPAPAMGAGSGQPPLAGRQTEMAFLAARLEDAAAGDGNTVLIQGETGAGKSRLGQETLQAAASRAMNVLAGRAYTFEKQLAYQPFAEAIDRYLAAAQRPAADHPLAPLRAAGAGDRRPEKAALFHRAATFLRELAPASGAVLFLDDLHAADEASLELFHYLARHARTQRFLLLGAYRTDVFREPASPFSTLLSSLYRAGLAETLSLAPLPPEAITAVAGHVLGGETGDGLSTALVAASEGNPFFAVELARAARDSEATVRADGRWQLQTGAALDVPAGLRRLLRDRVAECGRHVLAVLETAALTGPTFSSGLLQEATTLTGVELAQALERALQAGLIAERAEGYAFRHSLYRQALAQAQSEPQRKRVQALLAAARAEPDRDGG